MLEWDGPEYVLSSHSSVFFPISFELVSAWCEWVCRLLFPGTLQYESNCVLCSGMHVSAVRKRGTQDVVCKRPKHMWDDHFIFYWVVARLYSLVVYPFMFCFVCFVCLKCFWKAEFWLPLKCSVRHGSGLRVRRDCLLRVLSHPLMQSRVLFPVLCVCVCVLCGPACAVRRKRVHPGGNSLGKGDVHGVKRSLCFFERWKIDWLLLSPACPFIVCGGGYWKQGEIRILGW